MNTRRLLACALMTCLAACHERQVDALRFVPAALFLGGVRAVAVADVPGRGGGDLADLISHGLGQAQHFTVVDRGAVQALMPAGIADAAAGSAGPGDAARVGRHTGADALVVGRIVLNDYHPATVRCVISSEGEAEVQRCRAGVLRVRAVFRVIDVASGRLLGSDTFRWERQATHTDELVLGSVGGSAPYAFDAADIEGMRLDAYEDLARQFVEHITPHYERVRVTLYSDRRVSESQTAVMAAEAGDWGQAIALYRSGVARADWDGAVQGKYRARAHYNLGVALAYAGFFDEGLAELQVAQSIHGSDVFAREMRRVRDYQHDAQEAAAQRQAVRDAPPQAPTSGAEPAGAGAEAA